ncbi:MAG TPA: hypothetical protein PLD25_01300 [Chloroflexota bacterium]|nr:hypothetical protein [Chloroflexota bacterium]
MQLGLFGLSLLSGVAAGALLLLLWQNSWAGSAVAETAVLPGIGEKTPWYITRAAGVVAYLLLTGSTAWGLLLSTKIIKEAVAPPLALAMHNFLSWLALGLTAVHLISLLFDSYYQYTLADLFIPFIGPYRPGWVGVGILGFYLVFAVTLSFNFRKKLGQKRWRKLHYLAFVAYFAATVHGVMAGTDSADAGMRVIYLGSVLLLLFLTNYRLLASR